MANAAIAYLNKADALTSSVSASSAATLMPASRLCGVGDDVPHIRRRWRSTSGTANVTLDLGSDRTISAIALIGLTVASGASVRVRVSTSAGGATSGNLHDVTYTSADEELDPNYGMLVVLLTASVNGRYVRFDITDSSAAYVEAGRIFVGEHTAFAYNFAPGSSMRWVDPSKKPKTIGGQTLVDRRTKYREATLNFEWLTAAQRDGLLETIDRVNGATVDVLLVLDTAAANLPARTVFGLIVDPAPFAFTAIADIYSRTYTVEERL